MSAELALLAVIAAPAAQAVLVMVLSRPPGLRDVTHVGASLFVAACAAYLVECAAQQEAARIVLARPLPNVDLAFALEPFGALMAAVIAGLGAAHALHAAGVLRATGEKAPARLMAFTALSSSAAMAVAFSANLFTLFVALQALILAAFPLVAHRGDEEARSAGRVFLATLLAASMAFFLPAMVWTYALAGALEFQAGGVLSGRVDALAANALLVLYVFGVAAAATPPVHRWLPRASGAPFPAIVVVQAITVLPAGCAALIKIAAFVFGPVLSQATAARLGLLVLVGVAMCAAALIALSRQDIRERLAYSAMAQGLAATMGALLALPAGLFAAALQVVALTCAAATLTMAAGTVSAITGRTQVGDFAGLGRAMPWTFAGFAIASASMVGMPPFAGAWAKLWLITAAATGNLIWAAALAGVAAVLTFAHLGPLAANAFAARAPTDPFRRPDGASIMLVAPVIVGAAATLWLLGAADFLLRYLAPMWMSPT